MEGGGVSVSKVPSRRETMKTDPGMYPAMVRRMLRKKSVPKPNRSKTAIGGRTLAMERIR